jgi:hypothetical protein
LLKIDKLQRQSEFLRKIWRQARRRYSTQEIRIVLEDCREGIAASRVPRPPVGLIEPATTVPAVNK